MLALPSLHTGPRAINVIELIKDPATSDPSRVQNQKKWTHGMSRQNSKAVSLDFHDLHSMEPNRWIPLTSVGKKRIFPGFLGEEKN